MEKVRQHSGQDHAPGALLLEHPVRVQGGPLQHRHRRSVCGGRLRLSLRRPGPEAPLVRLHAHGHLRRGAPGLHRGLPQVLLQRERGHLGHHAQLDLPLHRQHHPVQGEGDHQPLHPIHQQGEPLGIPAQDGLGQALRQERVRDYRHPPHHPHRYRGGRGAGSDQVRL